MLLALDDTDGPHGGCTTHAALSVLAALDDVALRSMPRLVRLNPNCPHKTRGNGAVALELVRPTGPRVQVGSWGGRAVHAYPDGAPIDDPSHVLDAAWSLVESVRQPEARATVATGDVPAAVYWQAVQTEVTLAEVEALAIEHRGGGRSLVGCAGALAWPGPASSYELIAYREPSRWGTRRAVAAAPLLALDDGVTFHTYDPEAKHLACVPGTPCPVLAGLRGDDPGSLRDHALPALRTAAEPFSDWMLWATNHASGDHVVEVPALAVAPVWATVRMASEVVGRPQAGPGGHVSIAMMDPQAQPFTALAFEPTKGFRRIVLDLRPGDVVTVTGALEAGVVKLESIDVQAHRRTSAPVCCGHTMKSRGRGAGLRCRTCGSTRSEQDVTTSAAGRHEVPVSARRHLHRPLGWSP